MKRALFFIPCFLLSCAFCLGQSPIFPVFSLQNQATLKRTTARTFLIPAAGIQSGKNLTLVGPIIRLAQMDHVLPSSPSLTGIGATELYFFSREEKKLQFYLAFNSKYQKTEVEWESNYW